MKYSDRLSDEDVTIFLLHGVICRQTHKIRNYTNKHITQELFHHFLIDLYKIGTPLSMDDVFNHVTSKNKFPKKSFVITFDDGFENNYSIAKPMLRELNIPATFYVTTDFIDNNRMSWIDRIEYVVELSEVGNVEIFGEILSFTNAIESKRAFLNKVRQRFKSQKTNNLDSMATNIQTQLRFEPIWASEDPLDKKMNWQQISQLNIDPLCTVGGHTHTHPVLANLDDESAEKEILHSLKILNEKIGLKCTHYSYPEGLSNCYSDREIKILKNNGIVCCPSAENGSNSINSDLFHLKRVFVA